MYCLRLKTNMKTWYGATNILFRLGSNLKILQHKKTSYLFFRSSKVSYKTLWWVGGVLHRLEQRLGSWMFWNFESCLNGRVWRGWMVGRGGEGAIIPPQGSFGGRVRNYFPRPRESHMFWRLLLPFVHQLSSFTFTNGPCELWVFVNRAETTMGLFPPPNQTLSPPPQIT